MLILMILSCTIADRGNGGNRRYGNFSDDREEGGYGHGRGGGSHYGGGRDDRGPREDRYNNYGGNRQQNRGGGGAGGGHYERERQVSESMSGLSLEGNEIIRESFA